MLPPRDADIVDHLIGLDRAVRRLQTRKLRGGGGLVTGSGPDYLLSSGFLPPWWSDNYGDAGFGLWNGRVWFRGALIVGPIDDSKQYPVILPAVAAEGGGMPLPIGYRPPVATYVPLMTAGDNDGASWRVWWPSVVMPDGSWTIRSRPSPPYLPSSLIDPQLHLSQLSFRVS